MTNHFSFSNGKNGRRCKQSRFFFRAACCYSEDVKPLPRTEYGRNDPFAPTHWSVVLAAAREDENSPEAKAALAELCQTYWAPLYTFARGRGHPPHDAQDLTQGFFAHLIEHRIYEHSDPAKGKFRSFLLAAMKNFLANVHARDQAIKRGGGRIVLPLLDDTVRQAEKFYQWQPVASEAVRGADHSFERSWAQSLVNAAMERVSHTYLAEGKQALFVALRPFIASETDSLPAHGQVAAALGMPTSTVRSHVTRLRARYREALHVEVRRTVDDESGVREELSTLLRVLIAGGA